MGNKSFYDLDYIIELNEQRLEQYTNALQKNTEKFTTLLVIYSTLCLFLVPVSQKLFIEQLAYNWKFHWAFCMYAITFAISVVFSILQLLPGKQYLLPEPRMYYRFIKFLYEREGLTPDQIDPLIKAGYIEELEINVNKRSIKLLRKNTFHDIAFYFAILAFIPYLYCIWQHINLEKNVRTNVKSASISVDLQKRNHMWRRKPKHKTISQMAVENLTFKLPGVDNSKIIPVQSISGTQYILAFVPDKYQPKPIAEILYERLLEKERQEREAANKQQ